MNLKTATLVAIIGQAFSLAYWQCYSFFKLYRVFDQAFGEVGSSVVNLFVALIGQGSIIFFLVVVYSKQKQPVPDGSASLIGISASSHDSQQPAPYTQIACVPARVAGACLIAVLLLVNFAVHPLFGLFTLVGYAIAALIIGLLATRKNRDGWAWALLGGNALIIGLLVLMFMPFLCPRCRQPISNSDWGRKVCPKCGDLNAPA